MSNAIAADAEIAPEVEQNTDVWVIEPRRAGSIARAKEIWRYRRLLRYFATRAVQKQTNRTILGRAWIFIRPLFPLLVSTLIFGGVLGVSAGPVPYFLFLVVGTSLWQLFEGSVMWATRSLDVNRGLISRIYVPRLILPVATISPALVAFAIYAGVAVITALYYRIVDDRWYFVLGVQSLWSVLAVVLTLLLAISIGLWTAFPALIARDVRFTLGYVLGFWVFLTPVVYPLERIPDNWRWLVLLNPMAAYVEMFKFGLLGLGGVRPRELSIAVAITVVVAISGLWFFDRTEGEAADKV